MSAPRSVSFGSYRLLDRLGEGAMGVVYLAEDLRLGRRVALKRLRADESAGESDQLERFRARFAEEVRAASRLDHPGIVKVYEVGEIEGQPYFTMELVAGRPLSELLAEEPLPPMAAVRLELSLAWALEHAHAQGVIHRDVKPSNVLVDEGLNPHLLDFGLAKRLDTETGLTRTGAVVGTPRYLAPEQIDSSCGAIGPATDVYGAGAVLYECLTGESPNRGASEVEVYYHVLNEDVVPPDQVVPGIPRRLSAVCRRALAKDPRRRYATAGRFADDLHRILLGWEVEARDETALGRLVRAHRSRLAALLAALAGLFLWAGWLRSGVLAERDEYRAGIAGVRAELAAAAGGDDWPEALDLAIELEALGELRSEDEALLDRARAELARRREARAEGLASEARRALEARDLAEAERLLSVAAHAGPESAARAAELRALVAGAGVPWSEEERSPAAIYHRGWYYEDEEDLREIGAVRSGEEWLSRGEAEENGVAVIGGEAVAKDDAIAQGWAEYQGTWIRREKLEAAGLVLEAGVWKDPRGLVRAGSCHVEGKGWLERDQARELGLLVPIGEEWLTPREASARGWLPLAGSWRAWTELLRLGVAGPEGFAGELATSLRFRFRDGAVEWVDPSAAGLELAGE